MEKREKELNLDKQIIDFMKDAKTAAGMIDYYTERKKKATDELRELFRKKQAREYFVEDYEGKVLKAKLVERNKVVYDLIAMRENLSPKKLKLVSRSRLIADKGELREFIDRYPNLRDELRKAIKRVIEVDEDKLANAIEIGKVTLEDLEGCYKIESSEQIRLSLIEEKADDE